MSSRPSSPSTSARPGVVLADKYRLVRKIGNGGMGAVWEAQHTAVDRRFAVKLLLPELAASDDARRRFEREAKVAGTIESDHVVGVFDYGISDAGEPFIIMEYLQGEDLASLLARERLLAVPRIVELALQVARGLEKAHRAGVVHRDVKPKNLFLTQREDGTDCCKVLDFGVAKVVAASSNSRTQAGQLMGTLEYMSPEQLRGDPNIDERSDVYSLGCVLYEGLAGRRPYQAPEAHVVMYQILESEVPRLEALRPGLPEGLANVVHRCLAPEPKNRYRTVGELREALLPYRATQHGGAEQAGARLSNDGATFRTGPAGDTASPRSPVAGAASMPALKASGAERAHAGSAKRNKLRLGLLAVLVLVAAGSLWARASANRQTSSAAAPATAKNTVPPLGSTPPGSTAPAAPTLSPPAPPAASSSERSERTEIRSPNTSGSTEVRPTDAKRGAGTRRSDASTTNKTSPSDPKPRTPRFKFDPNNPYD